MGVFQPKNQPTPRAMEPTPSHFFFCDCIGMVMTVMTFLLVYQSRVSMGCRASERGRRENLRKPELLANEVWGRFFEGSFLLREATKKIFS